MQIVPPRRATRTYVQKLVAPPADVFPLLCPVREMEWVEGWDPELVVSLSGVAERDAVFITAEPRAVWTVIDYRPPKRIEFLKVAPELTVARISIDLVPGAPGTLATITYSHTALSRAGEAFVESFTGEHYRDFMELWEAALNRYLATGRPGT